ncbi:MAG: hypothetical protein FWG50_11290 [Kiritimatiellaeota bacterium]|nr:hypothetical protein [Kiritimatiellota bacterium]
MEQKAVARKKQLPNRTVGKDVAVCVDVFKHRVNVMKLCFHRVLRGGIPRRDVVHKRPQAFKLCFGNLRVSREALDFRKPHVLDCCRNEQGDQGERLLPHQPPATQKGVGILHGNVAIPLYPLVPDFAPQDPRGTERLHEKDGGGRRCLSAQG